MKIIRILMLLAVILVVGSPAFATAAWLHHSATASVSSLTITSTTAGNPVAVVTSSSGTPSTVKIGSQTMTAGPCVQHNFTGGPLIECLWYVTSATGGQTSAVCTGCTSPNFMAEGEASGTGSPILDYFNTCQSFNQLCQVSGQGAGSTPGVTYNPGYSSEATMFASACSGSSGTPTSSGLTGVVTSLPNGNPVMWGITSGTTQAAMIPTSPCGAADGLAIGFVSSGATQQLTSNQGFQVDEPQVTGGTSTSITVQVAMPGGLVILVPFCSSTCPFTSVVLGAQTAVCPSSTKTIASSNTGQIEVCYVVANTAGLLTATFTPGGSPSVYQLVAYDMPMSAGTSPTFDKAVIDSSCESGCTYSTPNVVNTPSATPTNTGELALNFVITAHHVSGLGSPWNCNIFSATSGSTQNCQTLNTVNQLSFITNAGAGPITPNTQILINNDPFQSEVLFFAYSAASPPSFNPQIGGFLVGP